MFLLYFLQSPKESLMPLDLTPCCPRFPLSKVDRAVPRSFPSFAHQSKQ